MAESKFVRNIELESNDFRGKSKGTACVGWSVSLMCQQPSFHGSSTSATVTAFHFFQIYSQSYDFEHCLHITIV
jgi:hypothetical protein